MPNADTVLGGRVAGSADGPLLTGQNPQGTRLLARRLAEQLSHSVKGSRGWSL